MATATAEKKSTEKLPKKPWRPQDMIEDNPIGLPRDYVEKLVPELDRHVASLFVLFHQYQKHHWLVEGPQFHDIHVVLQEYYEAVHGEVDKIAERMTAVGGIPTSNPVEQAKIAYVEHEPEGTFHLRHMLTRDRAAEGEAAVQLRDTIKLARDGGDFGTEEILKTVLMAVEDRAHHLDHFLGEDTLEMGLTAPVEDE